MYRTAPTVPRYVCVACCRSLSIGAGTCPNCQVARLELARPDVREEVRKFAERLLYRRMMREELTIGFIGVALGFAITGSLAWRFVTWDGEMWVLRAFCITALMIGFLFRYWLTRLYVKRNPGSAIGAYAARRVRASKELGTDVNVELSERRLAIGVDAPPDQPPDEILAHNASAVDPELAEMSELLRSIGARLDG